MNEKEMVRLATRGALEALSYEDIRNESRQLTIHIKEFLLDAYADEVLKVAIYHAMEKEADLLDLIRDPSLTGKVEFYFPRCVVLGDQMVLSFAPWPKGELSKQPKGWTRAHFGALEPPEADTDRHIVFDFIFLPCLATSPYGERLGHGRAFYDRFLFYHDALMHELGSKKPASYIAVCLKMQAVDSHLPVDGKDYILDGRMTPDGGFELRIEE